jgi:predicted transcriptional regulator of viral defense system
MMNMERGLEAYISREVMKIFEGNMLVAVNETLPGQIRIDFHFRDKYGTDIFVEVKARKIERSMLSEILNLYSAISNIEPLLKKFELVVVGFEVDASVKMELEKLPVKLLTFEELGIPRQKLKEIEEESRQLKSRKLSSQESRLVAKWEVEKKTTIRASDVQHALNCTLDYAYFLLHSLERKQWLERIDTGLYQFIPAGYGIYPDKVPPVNAFVIGSSIVEPYYFSYYTSNSHYGFTTQMPFTLFIATTKKKADVEWHGNTFNFVTLSKRKFFGYRLERVFDVEVTMAEPEKSLVDSFDKPRYAGGVEQLVRIAWRGLPRVDEKKLVDYALRMGSHSLVQRLGFITDFLVKEGLTDPFPDELRSALLRRVGKTTIYLDSRRPKTGKFSKEWRIVNNVQREQLLSEIEVR